MLIAMAGLPASGKSTLAARLAEELSGVIVSKDQVRAALFPEPVLDYSTAENDISMEAIFHAAAYFRKTFPQLSVIIDGRTFLRSKQIDDLFALAESLNETPRIIECVCSDEIARKRLEHDLANPPRNLASGFRNRLEEVLSIMVEEDVIKATTTPKGALVYSAGPNFEKYRQGDSR